MNLEARPCAARSGFLDCSVNDHSPADVAAGGCSYAATIDVVHTRAACVADLRDHAVRPMQWREWSGGLRRCREGQGKGDSDQPDHFFPPFREVKLQSVDPTGVRSAKADQTPEALFARAGREDRHKRATSSARRGHYRRFDVAPRKILFYSRYTLMTNQFQPQHSEPCFILLLLGRLAGSHLPASWGSVPEVL